MPKCPPGGYGPPDDEEDDDLEAGNDYPECGICGIRIDAYNDPHTFCGKCHSIICQDCWDVGCCEGPMEGGEGRRIAQAWGEDDDG